MDVRTGVINPEQTSSRVYRLGIGAAIPGVTTRRPGGVSLLRIHCNVYGGIYENAQEKMEMISIGECKAEDFNSSAIVKFNSPHFRQRTRGSSPVACLIWAKTSVSDSTRTVHLGIDASAERRRKHVQSFALEKISNIRKTSPLNSPFSSFFSSDSTEKAALRVFYGASDGTCDLSSGVTAVREVFEETGVRSEFRSLLSIRQQHNHPGAFGMSDMYIICRLRPLTYDINFCVQECLRCEWLDLAELAETGDTTPVTSRVATLLLHGLERGFHAIDLSMEEIPAVYSGMFYQLYHRPLPHITKS